MKKKVIMVATAAILFLVILMDIAINNIPGQVVTQMSFTKEISVVNHETQPKEASYEIVIEDAGEYIFYAEWKPDIPGLLTGCKIYSEAGEVIFSATADSCMMSSVPLQMEEGKYTLTLTYIASMEQWKAFFDEDSDGEYEYDFASDGQFTISYEFRLEKHYSLIGNIVILAFILGLALIVLIKSVTTKGDDVKSKYDERQELVQGRGYKYGFFTILVTSLIYHMFSMAGMMTFMNADIALEINCFLGICVCVSYCIWNEGYFALNDRIGTFIVIVLIGGVINLIIGIVAFVSGAAMQNGRLTNPSINLFVGIIVLIICGVMLLKKICKAREDEWDEEFKA